MKLINFRCPDCEHQEEELFQSNEEIFMICPKCGTHMEEFNFKNNSQRYFYCDPATK